MWCVPEGTDLRWRSWDGEFVAYHCASGDTHLLQPVAAAALMRLQKEPATIEELTRGVSEELGLGPEPGLSNQFQQWIQRLDELGLIERIDATERTDAG